MIYTEPKCDEDPALPGCNAGGKGVPCRYCTQALAGASSNITDYNYNSGCTSTGTGFRVELTWQGTPFDFCAAVSFAVNAQGDRCDLSCARPKCGGVTIERAVLQNAQTRRVVQRVTFDPLVKATIYAFFAQNVLRRRPTETASVEASIFQNARFIGTFPAPTSGASATFPLSNYDSIAPSLNDVSLRGTRFAWGSEYARLFCLNTKEALPTLHRCARYYDAYGFRNAGKFEHCPPVPEQKCAEQVGDAVYCSKNIDFSFFSCRQAGGGGYRELIRCPAGLVCKQSGGNVNCDYPPRVAS
jgi:hypothetical protein